MSGATASHLKAMYRMMQYCVGTKEWGLTLEPNCKWNGDPDFVFILKGKSDSMYASDEDAKSVTGYSTTLCGATISMKSKGQTATTLSVTESELVAAVDCTQDLLFEKRVLESLGLKVETPMILQVYNKGVMDLANNRSVGGHTRHITVRTNFLHELKEQSLLQVEWIPTAENSANMFTKNLQGPLFEKHASVYVSNMLSTDSQREDVTGLVLSHGQLVIESHVGHGSGLEQGSGQW
jgi:hypothetical protein